VELSGVAAIKFGPLIWSSCLLRRQPSDFDPTSFLAGHSEMARRIREFDWSKNPLGHPATWPVELRSALGIALNSAFPTCIYWGPELRLLYNDAWSIIPGPRHPACLGQRAEDVWSDIWHVIEPQLMKVITLGEGVYVRDQMLPMRRFGIEEETYWDYNFTPVRVGDGSIGGIFNSGNETTDKVLRERHTRFLLDLSDAFRGLRDADAVRFQPLEMLGRHLGVARVGIRQRDPKHNGILPVAEQWTAPGVEPISQSLGSSALADDVWSDLLDGHVIRLDGRDERGRKDENNVLRALGCASALAVPWLDDGETVAILFVHSMQERHWSDPEVQTVEQVLGRIMAWLGRAHALERERVLSREIDHRARNLLAIVRSIIRLARPEDPEAMKAKLLDRISALGKTHSLLSSNRQDALMLHQLIEEELAPYSSEGADKITVHGPEVILTAEQSQALAMALHELSTNAAKHGSLSRESGSLDLDWNVTPDSNLRLEWVETCLDQVDERKTSGTSGFGMRLLGLVVEMQLEGTLVHELTDAGLRCVIEVPLGTAQGG
jgi:two-component sensor histidine kinase